LSGKRAARARPLAQFLPAKHGNMINRFVADHLDARSELLAYARSARCGCVL
jgi:hypothetical protein